MNKIYRTMFTVVYYTIIMTENVIVLQANTKRVVTLIPETHLWALRRRKYFVYFETEFGLNKL